MGSTPKKIVLNWTPEQLADMEALTAVLGKHMALGAAGLLINGVKVGDLAHLSVGTDVAYSAAQLLPKAPLPPPQHPNCKSMWHPLDNLMPEAQFVPAAPQPPVEPSGLFADPAIDQPRPYDPSYVQALEAQRQLEKAATFGLLYGSGGESIVTVAVHDSVVASYSVPASFDKDPAEYLDFPLPHEVAKFDSVPALKQTICQFAEQAAKDIEAALTAEWVDCAPLAPLEPHEGHKATKGAKKVHPSYQKFNKKCY